MTILLLCKNILFPCNNMVLSVYRILFISHPRTTVRLSTFKIGIFSKVKQDRLKMDCCFILAPCFNKLDVYYEIIRYFQQNISKTQTLLNVIVFRNEWITLQRKGLIWYIYKATKISHVIRPKKLLI